MKEATLREAAVAVVDHIWNTATPPEAPNAPDFLLSHLEEAPSRIDWLLEKAAWRGTRRALLWTKTYYQDDLVVCLLRGGFTRVEQTLRDGGRGHAVIQQRMEFQEVMRDRFVEVVESATDRRVVGFMSGNQQDPDMICEVFVLAPTDLLDGSPATA